MFQFNNSTTTYGYELSTLTRCQDLNWSQVNISCVNISKEYHNKTEYNDETIILLFSIYDRVAITVCSLGLIMNILNIAAIANVPSKLTPHSKLVINLAVSDSCIVLHTLCSRLMTELKKYYDVGQYFDAVLECYFIPGVILVSLFNLLAFGIDQFIAIVKPLHYNSIVTSIRATACIALIWIVSFITVVIETIPETLEYYKNDGNQYSFCFYMRYEYLPRIPYFLVIPELIVLVLLYTRIYVAFKKFVKRRESFRPDDQHNNKAIVTTLLIIGTFMVSWVPYSLFIIVISIFSDKVFTFFPQYVFASIVWTCLSLILMNSCCDALIYAWRLEVVKQGYKAMFRNICRKCRVCFRKKKSTTQTRLES